MHFTDFWDFTVCGANRLVKFSGLAQTFSRHGKISVDLGRGRAFRQIHLFKLAIIAIEVLKRYTMLLSDQCLNRSFSYLCSSCAKPPPSLKFHSRLKWIQRRAITQNHLRRIAEEAETWASQALEIKAGRRKSLLSTLEERGYIHQVVG